MNTTQILNISLGLAADEINGNIENTIIYKLKKQQEGRCIREGYVMPGSIEIVNRSAGTAQLSHFNANFMYHIRYSAKICNPVEGDVIDAEITNVNKMGILAKGGEGDPAPLSILLAKQHHMNNDKYEKMREGYNIRVKIIGKRFDSGENHISIIGILED
jgi:DNA-directed RNA polymerase subunit E'/Rpb7